MKKKVFALAIALVLALGIVLTGCGGGTSSSGGTGASTGGDASTSTGGDASTGGDTGGDAGASNIVAKDEIIANVGAVVTKLDPQYGVSTWEWTINTNIYDTLWRNIKADYDDLQNWMVEDYTVSDDGLTWNVKLRDDIVFHDGTPLTAEDVKFTADRAKVSPYTAPATEWLESTEVVDDLNFIFHLNYAFPMVREVFADYQWGICSKNAIETYGEGAQEAVVGTGPYKLAEWTADNNIIIEYFEDFWSEDVPQIKKVTYRAITDVSAAGIAMRSGELDILNFAYLVPDALGFVDDPDNFDVLQFERDHAQGITFNNQVAPFDDINVRRAINHAIDKEAVNLIVDEGVNFTDHAIVKTSFRMEGYEKALSEGRLTTYEYDMEKAKALLAEAGYDESNPLNVNYVTPTSNTCLPLAAAVQGQLALVNVNLDVESMEPSAWVARVGSADFVTSYNDTGSWANRSPLTYYFMYHVGLMYNRENSDIARVNEITELGMQTADPAEREELYAELLEIVTEEAICCPLWQRKTFVTTTKGLVVYPEQMMLPIYMFDTEWAA